MPTEVTQWGLHRDGDLIFLHEPGVGICLTPGLERLESPFVVKQRLPCPHRIAQHLPLRHDPLSNVLIPSALERSLAPIPGDTDAVWLPLGAAGYLTDGVRLICPENLMYTPWANPIKSLIDQLTVTNLAPLVIWNYETRDTQELMRFLELPRSRPIILCGSMRVFNAVEIPWDSNLTFAPRNCRKPLWDYVDRVIERERQPT